MSPPSVWPRDARVFRFSAERQRAALRNAYLATQLFPAFPCTLGQLGEHVSQHRGGLELPLRTVKHGDVIHPRETQQRSCSLRHSHIPTRIDFEFERSRTPIRIAPTARLGPCRRILPTYVSSGRKSVTIAPER